MSSPENNHQEQFFLFVVALVFILIAVGRYHTVAVQALIKYQFHVSIVLSTIIVFAGQRIFEVLRHKRELVQFNKEILGPSKTEDSLLVGYDTKAQGIYIKPSQRRMHTQVIGTTNAGKTESVILPWAIDDIKKGRGLILVDGKADRSLLDKLYAYVKLYKREQDFKILSLCDVQVSSCFNPFLNGSVVEIAERIFSSLNFENEYYKSIQYDALLHCLLVMEELKITPTPQRVIEILKNKFKFSDLGKKLANKELAAWVDHFTKLKTEEIEQRTSGFISQLQSFCVGELGVLFNNENPDIDIECALEKNQIIYCQLPALKIPHLGKAVGKMILQSLQSAVSSRHLGQSKNNALFSVYLDDFTEYLTPSFVTLLNKSRSANVAITFAHQALGDLAALGDGVKNTILTNSNLKIFMRTNEPESAEYFSSVIGTIQTDKKTERQTKDFWGTKKTGEASVREAEEFQFHPNIFKQGLGVGEAVMVVPHAKGSQAVQLKFRKASDLEKFELPKIEKQKAASLWQLAA